MALELSSRMALFDEPFALLASLVLRIPALLVAVTAREVVHAWMAVAGSARPCADSGAWEAHRNG
jgi:hypothetical protein